jgi:hypothetical protein
MGFAIDNAGLVAAGRAASGIPGVLLTDSPVAAFFSGKPPSQLTGSQNLPADPAGAASWMRTHVVTALVLEDIGYYRATTIFPEPAAGTSTATLESLGNQATYQVASGKPVFAYRFGDGLLMQSIYPGVTATISPMPAQGKTAPLAKGLSLRVRADDAAGEGMGFGAPIAHYPDGWVYSRTATTVDLSTPITTVWKRTFTLDEIGGDAAHRYAFVPIASRGSLEVTYTVDATGVAIDVSAVNLAPGYTEVGILNEQSAAFDDFAEPGRTITGPAFGIWTPASGAYARLRSGSLGVEWSVPPVSGAQLEAGRELTRPDFNWAGLDYIFSGPFTGTRYFVTVGVAR